MRVERIGETFFAEIGDIDIAGGFDEATWIAFHNAYLKHQVLALHDQSLTAAQFHAFGERFGPVEPHTVSMYHHEEFAGITVLSNRTEMGRPKGIRDAGSSWHSDYSYKSVPANATMLYALEVPAEGGDTIFADLAAAYDALPDSMKERLNGLRVRQQYRWSRDRAHPEARWNLLNDTEREKTPEVIHPLVRTHPETGRKALYVNEGFTLSIEGLPMDESRDLLDTLNAHAMQPDFVYSHHWRVGDLVFWDNRAVMHCATGYDTSYARTMHRTTIQGDMPI